GLVWSILSLITWVILESMLRRSAVYLTGTYGAMGGARAMALPLPYFLVFAPVFEKSLQKYLYQRQKPAWRRKRAKRQDYKSITER
ncbi:MAG: hypothetical protein IKQ80_03990, partial [Clostridia bacterium]|nr:hypothetical protein [Clostridia bacterium]